MSSSSVVVGIDLAGSPKRITGICAMQNSQVIACTEAFEDDEIMEFILAARPELVTIDAPLHLPPGRKTLDDRNGEHYRPCDRELMRRGIRFFPITLGPMRMLTERGIRLKKKLVRHGIPAIEMYPGGAQDVWGIPRKQHGLEDLRQGLDNLGIRGIDADMNNDELDAVTGAYVGALYLRGRAEMIGDLRTGAILLPFKKANRE